MTFTVTWSTAALALLARVAAAHHDPKAVDKEAVWMDTILRRYPLSMGESRYGPFRLWYADLIGLWYAVDDNAMTVRIISVGPARRH
jgi:hypothetical protein